MVIPSEYISALHPSIMAVSYIPLCESHFNFLISGAMKNGVPLIPISILSESLLGNFFDSPKSNI